jgi:hypothetical protein
VRVGTWSVDTTTEPGILRFKIEGTLTLDEVTAFAEAHNRAVDAYGQRDYKVWGDLSKAAPLSQECANVFEKIKQYSSAHKNFRGSSVLVASPTIALQHRRTSIAGGVMDTEMISDDEKALREHLRTVYRRAD